MIIVIDAHQDIGKALVSVIEREGVAAARLSYAEAREWCDGASEADMGAIEAVIMCAGLARLSLAKALRARASNAIIALNERRSLQETLDLFALGVDDIIIRPVHVREILARVRAINSRYFKDFGELSIGAIRVFPDGRDPIVGGEDLMLPRRERRILEFLMKSRGAWATKDQIFNYVYGLFNEKVDENIIESHICRLRKRVKERTGFDPIESQRYLGYRMRVVADSNPNDEVVIPDVIEAVFAIEEAARTDDTFVN
jgi:DNA-binding response OmpR family regulator